MYALRLWSNRNARPLMSLYKLCRGVLDVSAPLCRSIGYNRLDRPVAFLERALKGLFFDCQMCGDCALSRTGMMCPMNCPKQLRNGPCGGVRSDGHCEVKPDMRCVWVGAWEGAKAIGGDTPMAAALAPVDHGRHGSSAWLNILRDADAAAEKEAVK
jgi:hypothetical protein